MINKPRINNQIRAKELRVIGPEGENLGVLVFGDALKKAHELQLDLIEISPNVTPPIAKIADFGRYQYEEKKKQKVAKSKSHTTQIKSVQVKVGTGEHDLALKARKASEWLMEGNRVKVDLFLPGRSKYLDFKFLKERLDRVLKLVEIPYKVTENPKKSPKGLTIVIEKAS